LLNGREIVIGKSLSELLESEKDIVITLHRNLKALGKIGRIKNADTLLPGVMICTYGKVIERTHFRKEPKEKKNNWLD